MLILSGASSGVPLCSFTTVISVPAGIVSASISLVFLVSSGIVKMFLKTMVKKLKIALLGWSKLSSTEKTISKALIDSDIVHEELTIVSNEAQYYSRVRNSMRMKDSRRGDIKRGRLIEHGKIIRIFETLRQ